MSRAFSTAIAFLLCCSLASAAGAEKNETPMETWKKALRERFQNCVGPLGPRVKLPIAANGYPSESPLAIITLSTPGMVSDGYYHDLYVYGGANVAYIIQIGGIAGSHVVYGPLRLDSTCLTSSSTGRQPAKLAAVRCAIPITTASERRESLQSETATPSPQAATVRIGLV